MLGIPKEQCARFKLAMVRDLEVREVDIEETGMEADLLDMAWRIAIHYAYRKGVHLSANTNRDVGNMNSQLCSTLPTHLACYYEYQVGMFLGQLYREVHYLIFASHD